MQESRKIPEGTVLIDLPSVRQQTRYSCGAACLMAICNYGIPPHLQGKQLCKSQADHMAALDSNPDDGTLPAAIVKSAKIHGLRAKIKEHLTIEELRKHLKAGTPVICAIQAYGTARQHARNQSGHYVVAIGYDDKNVYFMDPSIRKCRGVLATEAFVKQWHDTDAKGKTWEQLGIPVRLPKPFKTEKIRKVKPIE